MKKVTLLVSDETIAVSITTIEDIREIDGDYTTQVSGYCFVDVENGDVLEAIEDDKGEGGTNA